MTCETAPASTVGPRFPCFLLSMIIYPPPQTHVWALRTGGFFCFGEPAEGFGSFYLYVSMYCFLTYLGYFILGARRGRFFHPSRPLHLQRLKSQHHEKSSWECLPPLLSLDGFCLGVVRTHLSLSSLWGLWPPLPRGSRFCLRLSTLVVMFLPLTPHFATRLA